MTSHRNKRIKLEAMEHEVPSEFTVRPEVAWNYGDVEMDLNEQTAQRSETPDQLSLKERKKCVMCGAGDHAVTSCPESCCLKVCNFSSYILFPHSTNEIFVISAVKRQSDSRTSVLSASSGF